jgi:beta-mannosidase
MATTTAAHATAAAAITGLVPLVDRGLVRDYGPGEGFAAGAAATGTPVDAWVPIAVPGDVHTALIAVGRIDDPFYDRNEGLCAWMEEREWWYRLSFMGPEAPDEDERLRLVFHGLDTYATVYLNGVEIGRHENMFREAVLDVTERVRPDEENLLAVCFDPPLRNVGPPLPEQWSSTPAERVWMRKAQFGYGWDWGPRLPTVGIWRPVELRRERCAALTGVAFNTVRLPGPGRDALVEVRVEAECFAGEGDLEAVIELRGPSGEEAAAATVALRGDGRLLDATAYLTLSDPPLWWTHDLGDPALHDLRVALTRNGDELDVRASEVGVRTIELDQRPDPDEPGTRFFRFVLNGVALFARGANWIPAHSFVGAIERDRYERLVADARAANANMLRVWGGGIYEHDLFYDLCDRLGLLVWQDFMFACAVYPEAELAAEVELEARAQVGRLRNHPCLALWCGNNENQWIHDQHHPELGGKGVGGELFYDAVLPAVVAELDPLRPYWPGSPFGGSDHNAREQGNVHNWEVWHGNEPRRFGDPRPERELTPERVAFTRYAEDRARFVSEFGVLSAPDRETLRRFIPSDQLAHHSSALDHHTKDNPKNKVDMLLQSVTGLPDDLDEFVDFSMIAQAEAMKFGIEHYRRRKPHCSGTLVWQLNDCWPGLSWSLLDYHGFGKAAYFFVRRAFAPVLASFKADDGGAVELWVTNDTAAEVRDTARIRLGAFSSGLIAEEDVGVVLDSYESRCVHRWGPGELDGRPDRYLHLRAAEGAFPANRHFFTAIKDLERQPVPVAHDVRFEDEHEMHVRLRAEAYAYFVHIAVPDERVSYSDNYVELEPGEERALVLTSRDGPLRVEDISVRSR